MSETLYPCTPTVWKENPYKTEWAETDFLYTPEGAGNFPKHCCKQTYLLSKPFIKKFRNALDIGCRVGEYSRYLHLDFKHVYAFDPNLWPNYAFNVDLSKVTHFNCALGDETCEIVMYGGMHTERKEVQSSKKPCYRIDDFNLTDIDYIKIDVEGYEKKVLMGGERLIEQFSPLIVIEQNHVKLHDDELYSAKAYLERLGYRQVALDKRGWDFIMIRD